MPEQKNKSFDLVSASGSELPWFGQHIVLLWKMRMAMSRNRLSSADQLGRGLTYLLVFAFSVSLGFSAYWFMSHPAVTAEVVISQFYLNLLCFVTAMLWILWPILSAGVEDGSEKDRYQALPISDARLLMAALISGLLRPVGLFMFAPLVGACVGYSRSHGVESTGMGVALLLAFIAMTASWSQLGIYWIRDVLRARRNGESLALVVLLLILAGILLPPVDVGWLYEQGAGLGVENQLELAQFANVALAFSKIPPGYLGEGLLALTEGRIAGAFIELGGMVALAMLGMVGARTRLQGAHHREAATEAINQQAWDIFSGARHINALLRRREIFELWRNPRVRLLVTVPLVLVVVLHLISANELIVHFFGDRSQVWLMCGMGMYAASLILLTFTHNLFAYDGRGFLLLMSSPLQPYQIIAAKARVHFVFSLTLGVFVSLFYWRFVVPELSVVWWLLAATSVCALVPVVLISGLWFSVRFPVKFDASLNRQEKQPLVVSLAGFASCLVGSLPLILMMRFMAPVTEPAILVLLNIIIGLLMYVIHLPMLRILASAFQQRQALILSSITKT